MMGDAASWESILEQNRALASQVQFQARLMQSIQAPRVERIVVEVKQFVVTRVLSASEAEEAGRDILGMLGQRSAAWPAPGGQVEKRAALPAVKKSREWPGPARHRGQGAAAPEVREQGPRVERRERRPESRREKENWQVKVNGKKWQEAQAAHKLASEIYQRELVAKRRGQAALVVQRAARRWLGRRAWIAERAAARAYVENVVRRETQKLKQARPVLGPAAPDADQWLQVYQWKVEQEEAEMAHNVVVGANRVLTRLRAETCREEGCERPVRAVAVGK